MTGGAIIQFGTSRFLQAHADLMLSEARASGQSVGPVHVVETTGSPASRRRIEAFKAGRPFPVRIRGLVDGRPVDVERSVSGVVDGLSAREEGARLRALFVEAADFVISNTGDKGFDLPVAPEPSFAGWTTYPELLTALLHARFSAGAPGLTILPCELVERNGDRLRSIVDGLAQGSGLGDEFRAWLAQSCVWANSLVDRIVSAPIEPIGAVAEPYALWAIERGDRLIPPCVHDDIQVVDDLGFIERRKLFLLNLGHTLMAERWRGAGRPEGETVREMIADAGVKAWLESIIVGEVIPAFGDAEADATRYWQTCVDRFGNPFLDHRIADIAQNHAAKIDRRAGGFVRWARQQQPGLALPQLFSVFPELASIA
ncbi:mannitol dehydrogenase family protein [Mesorhizobium sp. BR1-1-16]|uniref:mannitol dehydrogenase family protein n=1 Tax=Mesorhizobium sp. BR1-1-16 TaxID=2876653 RepID=UPI001CCFADB2|nr:mannitol dehydrogenase family protein [Mesorhizobium sp. BR1-1-16]MBZ9938144.1 mannitol dehydrogenase family protein [Mesorhizobium sp. BR1-1-16]